MLKDYLNLKQYKRKTQIDSLLKKCKSKTCKIMHEALKKCLKKKLERLPQIFITNIKIDFNKKYLDKTVLEIYKEYNIIPSIEEFVEKNYIKEEKQALFKEFLGLTFRSVIEFYITSKQFIKDFEYIKQREGYEFALLFYYISKIYVQYFSCSKGNKKLKVKSQKPSKKNLFKIIKT